MKHIRERLSEVDVLDKFDRLVFESIVDIVGEVKEDGSTDPYKLIFVLKGMEINQYRMQGTYI